MGEYPMAATRRAMKIQEVILKAISGQLQWWQAAEIIGVDARTMRRWKRRYEQQGYDGLFDRRRRRPSPKRVPLEQAQTVLRLYREQYGGYNVAHFVDQLREHHQIPLSYQWIKTALQTAGLVAKRKPHGPHRVRRERRPMRGMLLYVDGSTHAWIPALAPGRQDLIAVIDDATSECYSALLVEEEGTATVMAALRQTIDQEGLFCSLYTDRGSHFFHTPKAGQEVDKTQLTEIGRALQQLGIEHIPSYSPQGRGRMERFFGSWQGRLPQELGRAGVASLAEANQYIRQRFLPWHNRHWTEPPQQNATTFVPCGGADLEAILCLQQDRTVAADNTVQYGRRRLQIPPAAWRCSFAQCRVRVCEHLDGTLSVRFGPHLLGRYQADGQPLASKTAAAA